MSEDIYKMELHDVINLRTNSDTMLDTTILRVAGGWIYTFYSRGNAIGGSQFVTFSNEMQ